MTLLEALKDITPGEVISYGKPDEEDFVEIFSLQDGGLRFSESTLQIIHINITTDKWYI